MIKKPLIIVIRFLLEGPSKLRLIKVIHHEAACPFCRRSSRDQRGSGSLARGTRRLINPGNIDGCDGLPRPPRQRDGWVRPRRGGCVCGHVSAPPRTGVSPSRRPPAAKHPRRGARTEPPARPTQGLHPFFMCCGPWAY